VSFVDEREDDEDTQQTLDNLNGACIRSLRDKRGYLYAREPLGLGDGKSVCRRRGSRPRGPHRPRMRVVGEMAFGVISAALPHSRCRTLPPLRLIRLGVGDYESKTR